MNTIIKNINMYLILYPMMNLIVVLMIMIARSFFFYDTVYAEDGVENVVNEEVITIFGNPVRVIIAGLFIVIGFVIFVIPYETPSDMHERVSRLEAELATQIGTGGDHA